MTSPPSPSTFVRNIRSDTADVYIGRPSPFGNPFAMRTESDRAAVIERFGTWFARQEDLQRIVRRELAHKSLGCYCSPAACHGDALAAWANDPANPSAEPVFVFGSNEGGRHGKGAALFAQRHRGAIAGVGRGRQGQSYAIATKDAQLRSHRLEVIAEQVNAFIGHARAHPDDAFDVSRVGCGLAGYRDDQIAPLFAGVPANCRLPYRWQRLLDPALPARVIIAGSRTIDGARFPTSRIEALLGKLPRAPVIVSGAARGVDQLGEAFAVDHGFDFLRIPAQWSRFGKAAGAIRNQHMSFLASHLVAVWDGESTGTASMIEIGKRDGLEVRVLGV